MYTIMLIYRERERGRARYPYWYPYRMMLFHKLTHQESNIAIQTDFFCKEMHLQILDLPVLCWLPRDPLLWAHHVIPQHMFLLILLFTVWDCWAQGLRSCSFIVVSWNIICFRHGDWWYKSYIIRLSLESDFTRLSWFFGSYPRVNGSQAISWLITIQTKSSGLKLMNQPTHLTDLSPQKSNESLAKNSLLQIGGETYLAIHGCGFTFFKFPRTLASCLKVGNLDVTEASEMRNQNAIFWGINWFNQLFRCGCFRQ